MWHSASLRGFTTRIEGSADLSAIAGADYVVVTAGRPRQPGMSRTDLTGVNAAIIADVAEGIRQHAPASCRRGGDQSARGNDASHGQDDGLSAATRRRHGRRAGRRAVSFAGRPDRRRAAAGRSPQSRSAATVPRWLFRSARRRSTGRRYETLLPADQIDAIVERARDFGAEVVKLLQKGSAYFAPAESAAAMVVDMVRESDRVQAACVQSGGAYGLEDTRVGLPVRLGPTRRARRSSRCR